MAINAASEYSKRAASNAAAWLADCSNAWMRSEPQPTARQPDAYDTDQKATLLCVMELLPRSRPWTTRQEL